VVAVGVVVPVKDTVTPDPPLTVPETTWVGWLAVKSTPRSCAPLIVTVWTTGLNVPFTTPLKT
jgi:hypothetical protein